MRRLRRVRNEVKISLGSVSTGSNVLILQCCSRRSPSARTLWKSRTGRRYNSKLRIVERSPEGNRVFQSTAHGPHSIY